MTTRINKTDGTEIAAIFDGEADTTSTALTLIGRLYRNYGELVNENFVKLLENFANAESPSPALTGQLWYDTVSQTLHVYRSGGFTGLAVLTTAAASPNLPTTGDLWYDTFNQQLKMFNGSVWVAVAPSYTVAQGKSGVFVENIRDNTLTDHVCIVTYQSGSVVSLHCRDPIWYPQNSISGLPVIYPGLNMASFNSQAFVGTATNSAALGGEPASKYLRNDISGSIDGSLTLASEGLIIGPFEDQTITVEAEKTNFSKSEGSMNFNIGPMTILKLDESTQALVVDGNDFAPAIAFIDEPTTGIYRVSENILGVSINGSSMLEVSTDGIFVNGNIQASNSYTGNLSAGDITASSVTTTSLNTLGTASINTLTVTGNATLGNAENDRVTINASLLDAPNDLTIIGNSLSIATDMRVGGTLSGYIESGTGSSPSTLIVSPGLYVDGAIQGTGSLEINGTLDVAGALILDGGNRLRLNSATAVGYDNPGDFTLGRLNGVRAYNTPKMWIAYNGTLNGLTVYDSYNIDFVTRTSTNNYTFTTENPIASGAMAVVGSNGTTLVANPSIGAITFSITTTSENARMALVVLSQ